RLDTRLPVPRNADEIGEMVGKLNVMLERLEGQFTNCTRFITQVAHELKTPLAVLLSHVQLQQKAADHDAKFGEFLHSAEEEVWRLLCRGEIFLILSGAKGAPRFEASTIFWREVALLPAINRCPRAEKPRHIRMVPHFFTEDGAVEPVVRGDPELLVSM